MKQPLPTRLPSRIPTPPPPVPPPPSSPKQAGRPRAWLRRARSSFSRLPAQAGYALVVLAIIGLVCALVAALLSLAPGSDIRSFEQHLSDKGTDTLDTSLVAQSFYSTRDNMDRIDVEASAFATFKSTGRFSLLEGDGTTGHVVYSASLDRASFANNPFIDFRFPPISGSADVTYTLVMSTASGPLSQAFGLRYSSYDTLTDGHMYTDEGAQRGDLALAVYYHYGLLDALGDVGKTVTAGAFPLLCWGLLLALPGLALLVWLPSSLSPGQRIVAAPGVTLLALPVFFLFTRAISLPMSAGPAWLLLLICLFLVAAALVNKGATLRKPRIELESLAFWSGLTLVFILTLFVRMLPLRDLQAGLGLDAYHHTLIAQMFVQHGGVPSNYEPFVPLSSFTYHFGFHAMTASVAWLTGQTSPTDMMKLMPVAGQVATALPVLTLTLAGWRVFGNRWAGLFAGTLAGLVSVFPAYYVNWSRYTQGLGLALLPVAMVLFLEVVQRPLRPRPTHADPGATAVTWQGTLRQSGPYLLGLIGAAGIFLTHYRIAIVYAAFVGLYVVGRFIADLRARTPIRETLAPIRRTLLLATLTVAALSPWLVNLAQNFRSHLVGQNSPDLQAYYDLAPYTDLLLNWSMLVLYALALLGIILAIRSRKWLLVLAAVVWVPLGIWSNPYLFDRLIPGFWLPYAGYLDAVTVVESLWLPLAMLAGYGLVEGVRAFGSLARTLPSVGRRVQLWRVPAALLGAATLVMVGLAAAIPVSTNLDRKDYITTADVMALEWMRDNLPPDSYVLANPFAFSWSNAVYGSDSGMWVPLVSGVASSVPPLPAYNEQLADPNYLTGALNVIGYEPLCTPDCSQADWQGLRDAGVTDIFIGSRGGALDVQGLLNSDQTDLLFHLDGTWVFALK